VNFQKASNKLNYLFPQNRWVLLVSKPEDLPQEAQLQSLRSACQQWGSKLDFPLELDQYFFDDSHEATEYLTAKLPGLGLLKAKKLHILGQELQVGYDPFLANQLLKRKLRLSDDAWGYLIRFGGVNQSMVLNIQQNPGPQFLRDAVEYFYRNHFHSSVNTSPETEEEINLSPAQIEAIRIFEERHGITGTASSVLHLLFSANRADAIRSIKSDISREPDAIEVNCWDRSIHFLGMDRKVYLPPLPFAIYCLYLENEEGFANKHRENHKQRALYWYNRVNDAGTEETNAINIQQWFRGDDKPFRDAVNKIKQKILLALGDEILARPYLVSGPNGGNKRVSIDRRLVRIL
jgi:hypothetical protein